MWKKLLIVCSLLLPLSPLVGLGNAGPKYDAEGMFIDALIIDKDPKGTNVRDKPGGKVIATVALTPKKEDGEVDMDGRHVRLLEKEGAWYRVVVAQGRPDEVQGWMHESVLGSKAGATEDGECHIYPKPDDSAKAIAEVPMETLMQLLDIGDGWRKLSYTHGGKKIVGWMPEQCLDNNPW